LQFAKKYAPIGTDDYQFSQRLGEDLYEFLSNNDRIIEKFGFQTPSSADGFTI